jgi:uncharacterized MAPEG superfamily protein
MSIELRLLIASIVLGLVHLIASSHLISWQRGYRWTASSREEAVPPLRGLANRVDQATTNFLETFPFFAVLILLARITDHHSLLTVAGAHLYFWGRVGYLLAAAAGYSLLRSLLCWNAALVGIVLLLIAILCENPTNTPNQTMQRTAGRLGSSLSLKFHPQPEATRHPSLISFSLGRTSTRSRLGDSTQQRLNGGNYDE